MESVDLKKKRKSHPITSANILTRGTYSWTLPLFRLGFKRDLQDDDLFEPLEEHKSGNLGDTMERLWKEELERSKRNKQKPSLLRVLIRFCWKKLLLTSFFVFLVDVVIELLQPWMLRGLISYFTLGSATTKEEAYMYAGGTILCSLLCVTITHPYIQCSQHMGMKLRVGLCSMIYRKVTRLSKTALGQTTVGQIVNLMSNDVNRFNMTFSFLRNLWVGPVQTVIITYLVYQLVGVAAFLGLAFLLIFIPFQGWLGKKSSVLRRKTAICTDGRVQLMNEIITGIQVIKMYAWEKPFNLLVSKARRKEVAHIRQTGYIKAVMFSFVIFHSRTSVFLTIFFYAILGNSIKIETAFVIYAYYNTLRQTMAMFFPRSMTLFSEALVSTKRIQTFLLSDETTLPAFAKNVSEARGSQVDDKLIEMKKVIHVCDEKSYIDVIDVCAKWNPLCEVNTLKNVSLNVRQRELTVVIGPVGSGKSSLLHAFLRELPLIRGTVKISGTVSYASQEPWLFDGSIRQNIIFDEPYNQARYQKVVMICALLKDFDEFPYSDRTIVGERGISLSGGQRARVNLARAIYKEADIYLLDDPLSAVDTHVGKHIFEDCIQGIFNSLMALIGFLKDKTVMLITHQVQYLEMVDQIVLLEDGTVTANGTYQELCSSGLNFTKMLIEPEEEAPVDDETKELELMGVQSFRARCDTSQEITPPVAKLASVNIPTAVPESRTVGKVGRHIYREYLSTMGGGCCGFFLVITFFVVTQGFATGSDYWLTYWLNLEENVYTATNDTVVPVKYPIILDRNTCIYVFLGLTLATITASLTNSFLFFVMCMKSSMKLHNIMFNSLSRTTMWFFNNNNSGRILNRFSKDIGHVDEMLPTTVIDILQIAFSIVGVVVVALLVNVWLIVPLSVCGIIFYLIRSFYIATSRSVKRLEGITRSPIYSHLNATLQGLTTIRATGSEKTLIREFDRHQDLHSSSYFTFISCTRAFGFWLDSVCLIYIAIAVLNFLLLPTGSLGADVGLVVTQSIGLTRVFQWGMRQTAELENQMTSVERVLEYSDLEEEKNLSATQSGSPRPSWPEEGKVEFNELSFRYSQDQPWILKSLTFVIHPCEKIGIVGRTGAGKSSLIQALFRLYAIEGTITIDGLTDSMVSLHDWRSKIAIIPQEPMLFSGTMRSNMDPFEEYSDEALWSVLEEVKLKEAVNEMPGGLQAIVAEGGSNLSVGQRQLVCLARAIIRNNKILVLDEATAHVDLQTDSLIQETVRRKFAPCTVLTIAHRLNTIMDSDRVLVMDAGTVVEFDSPHLLLQKKGIFFEMVRQTGRATEEQLHKIAENHYNSNQSVNLK